MRVAALAALVAAAVLTAGFAVQALGLTAAGRGDVIAANAAEWLRGYRYATSTLELVGHAVAGRCFHGWFGGRHLHGERGTILALGDGATVRALRHHRLGTRLPASLRPLEALELGGCTHVLGPALDSLAASAAVRARREIVAHRTVLALQFARLTLFVEPVTYRPLGVELDGIRSWIQLVRLTPSLARKLEALR